MSFHFPRHKYLGPGTYNFNEKPFDTDDAIAREHDLAYGRAETDQDVFNADKESRDEFLLEYFGGNNRHGLIGGLGLGAKNLIEQHLLGKPLYGMPPPKTKNWAAIRRINQRRQLQRERQQGRDDSRGLETQEERPQRTNYPRSRPNIRGNLRDYFSNHNPDEELTREEEEEFYINNFDLRHLFRDSPETQQESENIGVAMDTDKGDPGAVDPRTGGQAPGPSGTGGAASDGRQDIFQGAPQPNQSITLNYGKSYHFTLTNGLPDFRHLNSTAPQSLGYSAQLRFKNIHGIPWERLLMYLSEGELENLFRTYTSAKVEEVCCEVYSLGVRLPFVTAATTATVANANAQYPIGQFFFDKSYENYYTTENVTDIINKCIGAEWKNVVPPATPVTTNFSENFPNISASSTSRDINNPIIINYPLPYNVNNAPKDVGIYDHVNIKNGTTAYGKCWEQCFYPKNGILFAESTLVGDTLNLNPVNQNTSSVIAPIPGLEQGYFINREQIYERNTFTSRPPPYALSSTKYNTLPPDQGRFVVDYNGLAHFGETKAEPESMPKFLIGFVNIRNEDNSLLTAKWDILVKTRIRITATLASNNWVTRNVMPPPQWFTAQYQQFRTNNLVSPPLVPSGDLIMLPSKRRGMYWPTVASTQEERENEEIKTQNNLRHKSGLLPMITRSQSNKIIKKKINL